MKLFENIFDDVERIMDEHDIYDNEGVEEIFDADGMSSMEEGFMLGYLGG